jgi:lipooligosaccharide transport system permease protein
VSAALLVLRGRWTWYRRNWRSSAVSSVVQPVLFLVALGFAFGSQVRPGEATGGHSYLHYLAPGLLASAAVQVAALEATWPVINGLKWARTYFAVTATPVTPAQFADGMIAWAGSRAAVVGGVFLVVATVLRAAPGPGMLLALAFAVLAALAFAAPVLAYSSTVDSDGWQFNVITRFVVLPMIMIGGVFFPVAQLPGWLRPLAWFTPLWHGTELCRAAAYWQLRLWPVLGHLAYLLALLAVGTLLARRGFTRRMAV